MTFGAPAAVGSKGFVAVPVTGAVTGRARVTVKYSGGSEHVASYFVLPPLDQHVAKYAEFMSTTAWCVA